MIIDKEYRICTRCVMDTTAIDISFDENGYCNFCTEFLDRHSKFTEVPQEEKQTKLNKLISDIRISSKGKKYDCIVGVSGGVDSSYTLLKVIELGLKPLAVHMDNGWNSELAQHNIQNLVQKLNVDLITHVIDWEEYKALQQAFFNADVLDIELLYDNAASGVCYNQSSRNGLEYILGGTNQSTEGMKMPKDWNWYKKDKMNIVSIYNKFTKTDKLKLKTYPFFSTFDYMYFKFVKKIKWISFLDYFDYNKVEALNILVEKVNYKPYPYKHYESVFTRFYQGYLLPQKFKIDKRKLHFSSLIVTNQMSRSEAVDLLIKSPYPVQSDLELDKTFFLKKMSWSLSELENYIKRPQKLHLEYKSELKYKIAFSKIAKSLKNYAR